MADEGSLKQSGQEWRLPHDLHLTVLGHDGCWFQWKTQTAMGSVLIHITALSCLFLMIYFLGWGKCWIESSGDVPLHSARFGLWTLQKPTKTKVSDEL